jgi:tetratricopeptide (TPR) repeat protein
LLWVSGALGLLTALLLAVGAVAGGGSSSPAPSATDAATATSGNGSLAALQTHLQNVPDDWTSWAELGNAYVQQARITSDPSWYPKADGALARSLALHPGGNFVALTGQAGLAAARHDFAGALRLSDAALAIDPYSSSALAVRGDALTELGRYGPAKATLLRLDGLKPGLPSFTRLSYAAELRGDVRTARALLLRALDDAGSADDVGFVRYYLGELAFSGGDTAEAERQYRAGLAAAPAYVPLLAGMAKVEAATGRTDDAVRDYGSVVARLPQPAFVIEYGDLLASLNRPADARAQYDLVRTEQRLFQAQGVDVDLELAVFEADHGQPVEALRAASAELTRRRSVFVEDADAWALHASGRDREALAHADAALTLGTRNASFHFHRGVIEAALGDRAAATTDLRTALAINPHFSVLQAPMARRLLASVETA